MEKNPLLVLESLGQSVWLDYLGRGALKSGQLRRLIEQDGVSGVTSNPAIFEKAIAESHDYDSSIQALAREDKSVAEIYQTITVEDIQTAADLFRPTYDRLEGRDGFVSLEVSPHLAHDTQGTITEARRLWKAVDRPNLFIKVPATREGLPAIRDLISERINVNITLLFGLPRYRQVAEAYLTGLEWLAARPGPLPPVASVASFFLSRIDVLVDPLLEKIMQAGGPRAELARTIHGEVAIASAKVAGRIYEEIFSGDRFKTLAAKGARPQKLLWASTSTKNPAYPDLKYVERLIGPETINTMPLETLQAYRDHGQPALRLAEGASEAQGVLGHLAELEIDLDALTQQLEDEGIRKFNKPFDLLIQTLNRAREAALRGRLAARG
jgi:transaldolase